MTAGFFLNRYHKYKLMVIISAWGSFLLIASAIGTFQTKDVLIVAVNMIVAAFCLVPIIPVAIDFAGELTFPYESTVTTGFLLMSAQAFGFCLALIVLQLALIDAVWGLTAICICGGVASIISVTIKEDLRRIKFTAD